MSSKLRIAQIQLHTFAEKEKTIEELKDYFDKACQSNPVIICVGEMFACPYQTDLFRQYSEPEGGELWKICSNLAKKYHVYFSAGTMPERDGDNIYNTAYVFGRNGEKLAKYRKKHLFDIDIPGKQTFKESDILSAGTEYVTFDTEFGRVGLCICFDIRFSDQQRKMVDSGARLVLCPASFNTTTGPLHWELLFRARAVDNECFYIGTGGALDPNFSYKAYGHSIVVSPWGKVLNQMSDQKGIQITEINLNEVSKMRVSIPIGIK